MRHNQWDKSAVAERRADSGHAIDLENTTVLSRAFRFWWRLYRKAIEIRKNTSNYNRDNGIEISNVWRRVIDEVGATDV